MHTHNAWVTSSARGKRVHNNQIIILFINKGGAFCDKKVIIAVCPYNRLYTPTLICSSLPYFSYPYEGGNHTTRRHEGIWSRRGLIWHGTYDTQDFVPLLSTVQMTTSMGIIINHHNSSPTFAYDKILSHYCLLPIIFLASSFFDQKFAVSCPFILTLYFHHVLGTYVDESHKQKSQTPNLDW